MLLSSDTLDSELKLVQRDKGIMKYFCEVLQDPGSQFRSIQQISVKPLHLLFKKMISYFEVDVFLIVEIQCLNCIEC